MGGEELAQAVFLLREGTSGLAGMNAQVDGRIRTPWMKFTLRDFGLRSSPSDSCSSSGCLIVFALSRRVKYPKERTAWGHVKGLFGFD